MKFSIRETMFRIWYWYVNRIDRNAEVLFMNYGFSENGQEVPLDSEDTPNRYSIQLYHHLASSIPLEKKDIVEVGCGRGGGLSYIAKTFNPSTATGVDLNRLAISFCNKFYKAPELKFLEGDAQKLNLPDSSCDVVINVESSHRYPNMGAFLAEVKRILRPNGFFLFTDFRFDTDMDDFRKDMDSCGLQVINERNINEEVIAALKLDDGRRRGLVKKLAPRYVHRIALNFAGTIGSETYNNFVARRYVYFSYILQKA